MKDSVQEVLDEVHGYQTPAGRAEGAREHLLEAGRLLGVQGLHPELALSTIIARIQDHVEATGAEDVDV